jgi:hypothetical protein
MIKYAPGGGKIANHFGRETVASKLRGKILDWKIKNGGVI